MVAVGKWCFWVYIRIGERRGGVKAMFEAFSNTVVLLHGIFLLLLWVHREPLIRG